MIKKLLPIILLLLSCSGDFQSHPIKKSSEVEYEMSVISQSPPYTPSASIVKQEAKIIDRPMGSQLERIATPIDTPRTERIQYFYGKVVLRLSWVTPGDHDTSDRCGTDLDLHVIPYRGNWGERPSVWYSNPTGLWPPTGKVNDFHLSEDVLENQRAEYISGRYIQRSEHFLVGVHYYSNRGHHCNSGEKSEFDDVTFTLQFWVDGKRKYAPMRRLEPNKFWVGFEANGSGDYWKISRRAQGIPDNPRGY